MSFQAQTTMNLDSVTFLSFCADETTLIFGVITKLLQVGVLRNPCKGKGARRSDETVSQEPGMTPRGMPVPSRRNPHAVVENVLGRARNQTVTL
jgi:hypothetical protein